MVSETARQTTQAAETFQDARQAHQSLVFAFVSRRIKPREDAEDVTAEVFLDAYRHWVKKRGETRLWLLGIARRKIADAYRRRRGFWRLRPTDGHTADMFGALVQSTESQQALAILFQLPPDERDALTLQVLEELSIPEIAEVLGRTYAGTNSLLQRARERVRKIAEKQQ